MQSNYQEVKNAFKQKKVKNVCYLKFSSTLVKKKKIGIFKLKFNYKNYKKKTFCSLLQLFSHLENFH